MAPICADGIYNERTRYFITQAYFHFYISIFFKLTFSIHFYANILHKLFFSVTHKMFSYEQFFKRAFLYITSISEILIQTKTFIFSSASSRRHGIHFFLNTCSLLYQDSNTGTSILIIRYSHSTLWTLTPF